MSAILQYGLYLAILVILAIPLGAYIKKVMDGEKTFLSRILTPCENAVYKVMRIKKEEEMSWKKYAVSVLIFSGIGLIFLFLLQLLQGVLPGNPQNLPGVKWDLSFNTAVSFVTNTNWQAYSGESTLSYLSQALGLTVQNFVSAATGIAVLFAMIRGFIKGEIHRPWQLLGRYDADHHSHFDPPESRHCAGPGWRRRHPEPEACGNCFPCGADRRQRGGRGH